MRKHLKSLVFFSLPFILCACGGVEQTRTNYKSFESSKVDSSLVSYSSSSSSSSAISSKPIKDNQLYNDSGLEVNFSTKGARISSIKWGENKTQIAKDGFVVGRCANRIGQGKVTINGQQYNLTPLMDGQHLHGGGSGGAWQGPFANATWEKVEQTFSSITFSHSSPDGENGYPGNMTMTVKYTLSENNELSIEYEARSDKDTICNPTNHLYMSLNGPNSFGKPSNTNLKLWIDADSYTPLNSSTKLPTGDISPVAGTKYDYSIEKAFSNNDSYDDNYVLNGEGYRKVATMTGSTLGVKVDVYTDRPGLQLYNANNDGVCLETQMFPDMINRPEFSEYGTIVLKANETFTSKTAYCFSEVE